MNYDQFSELIIEKIDRFGRSVTLLNKNQTGYNPITDEMSSGDTIRSVKALFVDYQAKDIDGEIIQHGDKECLIAGKVDVRELIVDGTEQYNIVTIKEIRPGDTLIYSKVQVRG